MFYKIKKYFYNFIIKMIIPIILFTFWEAYVSLGFAPIYMPSFLSIFSTLSTLLFDLEYIEHILITLTRCFSGFFLAVIVAIPFGIILGKNRNIYMYFEVLIEAFRPMPSSALIPIAILFLGIDNEMKIFIIFFGSLWSILINTIDGVKNIEPMYLITAKNFNISKSKTFLKVILPAALPQIFSGLKISIAIALILTITVEMIIGGNGLGSYILDMERSFHFKEMYASIVLIGIIGYSINKIFIYFERKVLFWKY